MYDDYKALGFIAKTIWSFDNINTIKYYARQYTYPHFQDIGYAAWNAYNINGSVPLNYVVDPEGIVRYGATGFNEAAIRAIIESYLPGIAENTTEFQPVENLSTTPNPAKNYSVIKFGLAKTQSVKVRIYSSSGKLIKSMFDGKLSAGVHCFNWNLCDDADHSVANGIYFYEIITETEKSRAKITVLK